MNRDEMVSGIMRTAGLSKANVNRFYDGFLDLAKKQLKSEGELVVLGWCDEAAGVLHAAARERGP